MKNRHGFSLLEVMLITIIITSFLIMLPVKTNYSCDKKLTYFARMLENDIQYALSYTLNYYTLVKIYIRPEIKAYQVNDGVVLMYVRNYDAALKLTSESLEFRNGFLHNAVTLKPVCGGKTYQITISLRSGAVSVG